MLLHIPHIRHLQELLLLPVFQRAVIDFLAGVFHTAQKASVLVWKMVMLLDVGPKFIYECVPAFGVGHILKSWADANDLCLYEDSIPLSCAPMPEFPRVDAKQLA